MLIDTHKAYEELTAAGADPRLAEVIIRIHQEADEHAATKQDLEQGFTLLERNLERTKQDLERELALLEQKLLAAMNRRALALILGILGGMWGLLELYL